MRSHAMIARTTVIVLIAISTFAARAGRAQDRPAAVPRSDARVLHVDFENYVDGVVQALNAGVRWLGDPFTDFDLGEVEITAGNGAFAGRRSARVSSLRREQIARVRLQRRFDAPAITGDMVVEFVFRAGAIDKGELDDLVVWSARSSRGRPVGLILHARGNSSGPFQIDATHAAAIGSNDHTRTPAVMDGIARADWIHFVLARGHGDGVVELWGGRPGAETKLGVFADLDAEGDLATIELGDVSRKTMRGSGQWDDVRVGGRLAEAGDLAPPEPPLRDVGQEKAEIINPIRVGRQKQLFTDDVVIENVEGVRRTVHAARKHPKNPLIVPEKPWEGRSVLLYGHVMRDPNPRRDKLRMWYLAWGKHVAQPSFICLAESSDGIHWERPVLNLHAFAGSTANNIVLPGWDQVSLAYDVADADPARRYKALVRSNGTRGFVSPDGLRWSDAGVLVDQAYDATTMHWDPVERKWVAMVKIFKDGKRARGYAESRDFQHWSDTYFMATVDEQDAPGDQMYALAMFHYETVYLGLLRMYHTDVDKVDVQLATSRNGKRWTRPTRAAFIPTGPNEGDWDFGNNAVPSNAPLRVGDELWFYYSGRSTLHNQKPNDGAIGLATLRVDGFASMDAAAAGTLTTGPLLLDGKRLYLNADAADGEIRVETLDALGHAIDGFAPGQAVPIRGDGVRQLARWEGDPALPTGTVRLRFHLRRAGLYAFWVE